MITHSSPVFRHQFVPPWRNLIDRHSVVLSRDGSHNLLQYISRLEMLSTSPYHTFNETQHSFQVLNYPFCFQHPKFCQMPRRHTRLGSKGWTQSPHSPKAHHQRLKMQLT